MRSIRLIFIGCVALLLCVVSCSKGLPAGGDDIQNAPATINYISVNIVSGGDSNGSRATRAPGDKHETGDGNYFTGYENENQINSVRFYFFKANGDAAYVRFTGSALVNYLDLERSELETSDPAPGDDVTNIEKIVNAQLVINTRKGDESPSWIIAIVNPPQGMPVVGSIDALNDIANDYSIASDGYFVMSNSVYVDDKGEQAEAVSVKDRIYTTVEEAILNPVIIHVERVNAKITVECKLLPVENMDNTYDTGVKVNGVADKNLKTGKIYVRFSGWDVTQATNKSYLMKHIDERWTDKGVFGDETSLKWNMPVRYRSFWAINPNLVAPKDPGSNYIFKTFKQHQDDVKNFGGESCLYMQENAAADASSKCAYPTQLIVAAQLVGEDGKPLTLCEYGFLQYTIEGLKIAMANNAAIYKRVAGAEGEGMRLVKIDDSDLVLLSATEAGQAGPTEDGRYFIYAAIKGTGADGEPFDSDKLTDYYIGSAEDAEPVTYREINAQLAEDCGRAKLWQEGRTYYYVDIPHLGSIKAATEEEEAVPSKGAFGIVRNHIYALNITRLTGLGTPVYRPDEVIYPEKPDKNETYIGAEVEILNWRLVNENVSFAW